MRVCPSEVEDFLKKVRESIDKKCCTFIPRKKNIMSMTKLGLQPQDVLDEIYDLTYSNYIKGPEDDHDVNESDPFWMFKAYIIDNTIYIKIKIVMDDNNRLKIVSFHIDEI